MKENNTPIVRKIVKIMKERFIIEHWRIEKTSNNLQSVLSKCERCINSSKNSTRYIASKSLSTWYQVILGVIRKGKNLAESKISILAYLENTICILEEITDLCKKIQVELLIREEAIIQKVIKEEAI